MKNKNTPVDYGTYVNELDMFASEWVNGDDKKWSNNNNEVGDNYGSFVAGYNKAKETLYTEEDLKILIGKIRSALPEHNYNHYSIDYNGIIKSLKQK
jgi:hypothetical protein